MKTPDEIREAILENYINEYMGQRITDWIKALPDSIFFGESSKQAEPVAKAVLGKREVSCHGPNRKYVEGIVIQQLKDIEPDTFLYTHAAPAVAQAQPVAWESALEFAAQTIELYDDATMRNDYMLDASECAAIIRALKPMHPAQPVQSADVVLDLVEALDAAIKWGAAIDEAPTASRPKWFDKAKAAYAKAKEHGL